MSDPVLICVCSGGMRDEEPLHCGRCGGRHNPEEEESVFFRFDPGPIKADANNGASWWPEPDQWKANARVSIACMGWDFLDLVPLLDIPAAEGTVANFLGAAALRFFQENLGK
jgi:hypothetical protein